LAKIPQGDKEPSLLRYCAWCGEYQGATSAQGHQIRKNICEIDTTTICAACLDQYLKKFGQKPPLPT